MLHSLLWELIITQVPYKRHGEQNGVGISQEFLVCHLESSFTASLLSTKYMLPSARYMVDLLLVFVATVEASMHALTETNLLYI